MTLSLVDSPIKAEFFKQYEENIIPYFKQGTLGKFSGKDQVSIAYSSALHEEEKAVLVILPGRGEPLHKYAEVIYDLKDLPFSIFILSHRGQGESGLVDGCKIQYVRQFEDYIEDLDLFMEKIVHRKKHSKVFLLAHSMGGMMGALYAQRKPKAFDAIVFSAPMFDMDTQIYSKATARLLSKTMVTLGLGKVRGGRDTAQLTSSSARNAMTQDVMAKYSSIRVQEISYRWALSALEAVQTLSATKTQLEVPFLLLQAGRDLHVPPEGQELFLGNNPQGEKVFFPTSFHEILMEQDSIRSLALERIRNFFLTYV